MKNMIATIEMLGALSSLFGAVFLARSYYLVTFAVGYGIKDADRNQQLFLRGAVGCSVLFVVLLISFLLRTKRNC